MARISQKLLKGSTLRLIVLALNIAVGFFIMPFLIHSLGDDQYGLWVLAGAVVGFYGLLDVGMSGAIQRFLVRAMHSENNNEVNVALSSAVFLFSVIGLLSIVITVAIVIFGPHFIELDANKEIFQMIIWVLGIKIALMFPFSCFTGILLARLRFDTVSYLQLFSLLFRTALIVYFINQDYGILAVAVITSIDALIEKILTIYFAKKLEPSIKISLSYVDVNKLKEYYHFGKYTYITTIADRIRFSIDELVIGAVIGVGAVTHYVIAATLIFYFGQVVSSVFGVIGPVLHKYHKLEQWDNLREVFVVISELTALTSIFIGGLLITFGYSFILLWVGEDYNDVYIVLIILCASSIMINITRPCTAILYSIAKHKYYAKVSVIEAVANFIISVTLVQYIGIYGVALGTAIPALINFIVFVPMYTCRQLGVSFRYYCMSILKYFVLGIALFLSLSLFLYYVQLDSYPKLLAMGIVSFLIYAIFAIKFVISKQTMSYINELSPDRFKVLLRLLT